MAAVACRGVTTCDRARDMFEAGMYLLPEDTNAQIYLTQGSWSTAVGASAGTHSGCGVVDVARFALNGAEWSWAQLCQFAAALRQVGFAAWPRERIPGTWERHIHIVAVNCDALSSAAANQVVAYHNGRDGLAGNGPDVFDRTYANATWESFQASHPNWLEDHEMNSTQDARLNTVYVDVEAIKADVAAIKSAIPNIQYTSNDASVASHVDLDEDRNRFVALAARLDKLTDAVAALTPKPVA